MMHDSSCDADKNKFFTEACKSKSDGNLRQEKNAGISGKFYGKVLRESFTGKFYRKFYGKVLRESFTGKWGARFGLRLGKVADPPQVQ